MLKNSTGYCNTAIGQEALYNNTTGLNNSAVGYYAMLANTTGDQNTANGFRALNNNTDGQDNTALGMQAAGGNTTGDFNTIIGSQAYFLNNTGSKNTVIGYMAGRGDGMTPYSKSGNVFIGYRAGFFETGDNKLYIENTDSSTPLIYGDFDTDHVTINDVLRLTPRSTAPTSPAEGEIYVNYVTDHIYCYLNGGWRQLDN